MESGRPRVLVMMATFNGAQWLQAQLESIVAQQGVEVELLVADDHSSDGTAELLQSASRDISCLQLLHFDTASGSAGANFLRLFKAASWQRFDFVALADQDDLWEPEKLLAAIRQLEMHMADGYSCAVQAFWADGRREVLHQDARQRRADFLFEGAGQGCTFVLRAGFFGRVQAFCTEQAELASRLHYHDWLLYLLARAWQRTWVFDSHPWLQYRQHGGNEIGARGSSGGTRRRLALIREGWYRRQVQAACSVYVAAGGQDPVPITFAKSMARAQGASRGRVLHRAWLTLRHSRRRLADRLVVTAGVLAGWI